MLLFTFGMVKMYIVCLNIRQNHHKFSFLASQHREVWEILILVPTNIDIGCYRSVYLGNFQECLISCYKYWQILWPLSKFRLCPSLGTATRIIWLHFGKFLLFPLNFGPLAVKTMAFFEISSLFIIKPSVDHTSYKYCVLCMVKHKYFQYSPHILAQWS